MKLKVLALGFLFCCSSAYAGKQVTSDSCERELSRTKKVDAQPVPPPAPHPLTSAIDAWTSKGDGIAFSHVSPSFFKNMHSYGATAVTVGGTSINALFSANNDSVKIKYDHPPTSAQELAKWIADSAEPELKVMAAQGRFQNGEAPILILPAPGFVIEKAKIVLPGNFGTIGNFAGLPLAQDIPGHALALPLSELVRAKLVERAEAIGIASDILARAEVDLFNDALPVAANAAYTKLKSGQHATVLFVGTGTGSAKVQLGLGDEFEMTTSEESQSPLKLFPKKLLSEIPEPIMLGARLARTEPGQKLFPAQELTLENLSGGGRQFSAPGGNIANHLVGADTIAVALLLPDAQMPQWVRERVGANYEKYRRRVLKSLGLREKDLRKLLVKDSPDSIFVEKVKSGVFVDRKTLKAADKSGSKIADKLRDANARAQGLVAGFIAMNVGKMPAGNIVPPDLVYGQPDADGVYRLHLLVRASAGLNDWQKEPTFEQALIGIEKAHDILLGDSDYRAKLQSLGMKPPRKSEVLIHVDRILQEELTEHPDFTGLDKFAGFLRAKAGKGQGR